MPKASDVYPRRNLPGSAEEWGRRVEAVQQEIDDRLIQVEQSVGIHDANIAGQGMINQRVLNTANDNTIAIDDSTNTPLQPENVTVFANTGYWLDDGTAKSVVAITFDPVVYGINGSAVSIDKYELWSKSAGIELHFDVSSTTTTIVYDGWTPGVAVEFSIKAKSIYGVASSPTSFVTVTPAIPTAITPKAPTGVTLDSNTGSFAANNQAIAVVDISWTAVTEDVDSNTITVAEYEVWVNDAPYARTSTDSVQLNLSSGLVAAIRVRAKSVMGTWGDLSDPALSVTAASPTVATRAPSTPTLTTGFGIVTVKWDGTYSSGGYGSNAVFIEQNISGTWTQVGAPFTGAGSFPIQSTNGATVQVRLVAYDVLGRATGTSSSASITCEGVDTGDITTSFEDWIIAQASGVNITVGPTEPTSQALGDLWFETDSTGEIIHLYISDGTVFSLYVIVADTVIAANSVTTSTLNADEIWANELWINKLRAGAVEADIITTDTIGSNGTITLIAGNATAAQTSADTANAAAVAAQSTANTANSAASSAQTTANAASAGLLTQQSRFIVTSTGAKVQSSDATQSLELTPTGISIVQNGVTASTWSANKLTVPNVVIAATVGNTAEIGGHVIEKYATTTGNPGRTTFKALVTP